MRYFTLKTWFPLALLLLLPLAADAAGLGRLNVLSAMGQPLQAEIELLAVQKEEMATLSVRLASSEDYRKANLEYGTVAAGVRLSIEKRADGRPYIRVTSVQPVNEPFVDVLIELNWASGRLMREYTALLDPPGLAPEAAAAPPVGAPPPMKPAPVPRAAAPVSRETAMTGSYGPIQRGETLGAIARSLKPDDVTLEQMLVGLFRSNPDAFIRKNLNLVRSGRVLRVPDRQELAAIPREEAVREYRAQVADWNSYRASIADAAGAVRETRGAASGRITGKVEDKAVADAKDVVRLSKGEAPGTAAAGGKPGTAGDRIRSLEEELVAREKALNEANERVAQLEKTIKDMQRLAEIKSPTLAAAQKQAEDAKSAPKPAPDAKADRKPETAQVKPAPKPAPPKSKPAPPEPSLMDTLTDPLYLAVGGGLVALLLGYLFLRRRRRVVDDELMLEKTTPTMGAPLPAAPRAAAAAVAAAPAAVKIEAEDVDALEEARVYMSHGRDAQAESVLVEALGKNPQREELHVKLLEIYAARGDKSAFGKYAADLNRLTGGKGENWLKVAAMGYALEPENGLYAAGKDIMAAASPAAEPAGSDLDFNLDIPGQEGDAAARAPTAEARQPAGPLMPDFNLEVPEAEAKPSSAAPAQPGEDGDAGLDFKLDIDGLDLELDEKPQAAAGAGHGKDAHWHDVQTKFDLAKAYEEMDEKDGARRILEEVLKEGDADQQAQARKLLDALG